MGLIYTNVPLFRKVTELWLKEAQQMVLINRDSCFFIPGTVQLVFLNQNTWKPGYRTNDRVTVTYLYSTYELIYLDGH